MESATGSGRCIAPRDDDSDLMTGPLCGAPAVAERVIEGLVHALCAAHAAEIDIITQAEARATSGFAIEFRARLGWERLEEVVFFATRERAERCVRDQQAIDAREGQSVEYRVVQS